MKASRIFSSLVCLGFLIAPVSAKAAPEFDLNFAGGVVETHPLIQSYTKAWWFPEIEKRTNGRVTITYYNPNTLVPEFEVFPSVAKGIVDMGGQLAERSPMPMDYTIGFAQPGIFTNALSMRIVPYLLMEKYPNYAKELAAFKVIDMPSTMPMGFASKKPIKTLEDLKGLKIIVSAPSGVKMVEALGATPVVMAGTEMYIAMQRGMADAALGPIMLIRALKLNEVCKYFVQANLKIAPSYTVMDINVWNKFPADIQEALTPLVGLPADLRSGTMQQNMENAMLADLTKAGMEIYFLPEEERDRWVASFKPIHEEWIKSMEAKGHADARDFYNDMIALADKYNDLANVEEVYLQYEALTGPLPRVK